MPLPTASETMQAAMKAASDYYFEHEYPDVPPEEKSWPSRPRGFA
jgi:hypothetical protein